jgi:hypothetical protein
MRQNKGFELSCKQNLCGTRTARGLGGVVVARRTSRDYLPMVAQEKNFFYLGKKLSSCSEGIVFTQWPYNVELGCSTLALHP